jgi:hypothetical protein
VVEWSGRTYSAQVRLCTFPKGDTVAIAALAPCSPLPEGEGEFWKNVWGYHIISVSCLPNNRLYILIRMPPQDSPPPKPIISTSSPGLMTPFLRFSSSTSPTEAAAVLP